jgi:hypothetical protein
MPDPDTSPRWKQDGVRVVPGCEPAANTAQAPGCAGASGSGSPPKPAR